jgi:hypothetical protein
VSLLPKIEVVEAEPVLYPGQIRRTERRGGWRLAGHLLTTSQLRGTTPGRS